MEELSFKICTWCGLVTLIDMLLKYSDGEIA